jgi:MoaA/NifB/PqqE/SkfB family radical SAM enzyme
MGEQGGPCDKSCEMCYYAHQKNLVFFSLETLLQHANLFRHYYGLDACDISGGEATIYKTPTGDIVDLVRHCARIGLAPTIITHGQNIRDDFKLGHAAPLYKDIEAAGLDDWLISLHGNSPASHDKILCQDGSFARLIAGLDLVQRPVRFNTTLLLDNYKDLPYKVLCDRRPTVWNCIMFNPFHYWSDKTGAKEIDFQVQYREAAPYLARAIDELEARGWECNVRYWPLCIAREFGFEANVCGYHQVPFDPWEWRLNVTQRTPLERIEAEGGWYKAERNRALQWMGHRANEVCESCSHVQVCDRPPEQYQAKYGLSELRVINGPPATDPIIFQRYRGERVHAGPTA